MILGFKPLFKPKILDGTKIHSIREDIHDRWEKGKKIHFATGVRTKNYNQFDERICTGIQNVYMSYAFNDLIEITVDDKEFFGYSERLRLAQNDGFDSWEGFFNWFYPIIAKSKDNFIAYKIIHWTPFRY